MMFLVLMIGNILELIVCIEKINRHVDAGHTVDIIYLNFQVFDMVPQRFLRKLHS